jgi:hypothetical protein
MLNGLWFHSTGKIVPFVNKRTESFQTERGMRIALRSAGFRNTTFTRPWSPIGKMLIVEAVSEHRKNGEYRICSAD